MDLLIGFGVFLCAMVLSLIFSATLIFPMILGLCVFFLIALRRGFKAPALVKMVLSGAKRSLVVVIIMFLIGALTALWRQCGTIAYFTYYGIKIIPSGIFILSAFLLSGLMSYALGTSFGTCSAVGIILMTIARTNGISPVMTGGAIMSGIYIGDRGSPASSSASLVANETGTDLIGNVKTMMRVSVVPLVICTALYAVLSLFCPAAGADSELLELFPEEFSLSVWCLLPTVVLLVLAFAGMKIRNAMAIDIGVSFILCLILQKATVGETLRITFLGFTPANEGLAAVLSGGGVRSMLQIIFLLLISNGCAGIFHGTGMLAAVEQMFCRISERIGRFPAMVIASFVSCFVFCNQTIGVVMCRQCMEKAYPETVEGRSEMMIDLEDSVITIAGIVPWCIACSVPFEMMGCGFGALLYSFYLYIIPIWHCFYRKIGKRKR